MGEQAGTEGVVVEVGGAVVVVVVVDLEAVEAVVAEVALVVEAQGDNVYLWQGNVNLDRGI
jgi:hypothetical protein